MAHLLLVGVAWFQLLLCVMVYQANGLIVNCTERDFGLVIFPCDVKNRTRSYFFFMKRPCNPLAPGAYFPKPKTNIPCDCPPGQGLLRTNKGTVVCQPCQSGEYSVGGELIDTWKFWNSSNGIPGSSYRISVHCADIVVGGHCESWKPGGNYKYLISGAFRNSTGFLSCLQQKSMVMYRNFVNKDGQNFISFRYKVDGGPCPKHPRVCSSGLHFYVDEKRVLHADVQFRWTTFSINVSQGNHIFRWIYQSSCKRSDSPSLDVAFIGHLALVGAVDPYTRCRSCPSGTYTNKTTTVECTKCKPGTYQNLTGQTECKPCPSNTFSRIGDENCTPLPPCRKEDYTMIPLPVSKCYVKDEGFYRTQRHELPKWPGMDTNACHSHENIPSPPSTVKCACQPGYSITKVDNSITCKACKQGTYSFGNTSTCLRCPSGSAAIPGLYIHEWQYGVLPDGVVTNCSKPGCKNGWISGGSFVRTERIAGNFETYMEIKDVQVKYFRAKIKFQCSVDCRINPGQPKVAKESNCFMRFTIKKGGRTLHDKDCVHFGRGNNRNGTIMRHSYSLKSPGPYTFRWLFHHGDSAETSLYSFEGRVHQIEIDGVEGYSAKSCVVCQPGTFVSKNGSLCLKCPKGTFSEGGSTKCKPCPAGTFTSEPGSSSCKKCGRNTVSNSNRDGCDFNKCKYSPAKGIVYDLSPLGRKGGAMTRVVVRKGSRKLFQTYYYVNPCYLEHDNSSCMYQKRILDEHGTIKGYKMVTLPTMACRKWAFYKESSSLGSVVGYIKNEKNPAGGLTMQLLYGFKCHDNHLAKIVETYTHIDFICDDRASYGFPTQLNNKTAIEKRPCFYHMAWRSLYACPFCNNDDYETVYTKCIDGYMNTTIKTRRPCRRRNDVTLKKDTVVPCRANLGKGRDKRSNAVLIVVIVLFTLITLSSVVVIMVVCRRNHLYRMQLFSSGKTLAHLQKKDASDFQELISDDTY